MPNIRAYYGITVTVTASRQSLLTLLRSVETDCPGTCRELLIQSSNANSGKTIYVGDASVATSGRAAMELAQGESRLYRDAANSVPLSGLYVIASDASTPLNVEILTQ